MSEVRREWVSCTSPVSRRNGAGFNPCQGLWYRPANAQPRVAFIATHYNVDFSEHYLGPLLAERGFGFLGWNTRYRGNEAFFLLDQALVEIGEGVRWLREQAGVETVVLLGNSGGGSLMAAYQSQAVGVTMTPAPDLVLPDALEDIGPGDLYISLNAHAGRPEVMTAWMDASVVDETDPLSVDPVLDPFHPDRAPPYDEAFVRTYRAGQATRNRRISAWAREELTRLAALGVPDRTFLVHRVWADLRFIDPALDPSKRRPMRCYAGDPRRANFGPMNIGGTSTLRSWLSMWSLDDSWCSGAPHLPRISVPSLVIQSDADTGVFPSDARAIHDLLGASDRTLEMVPGDHYLEDPDDARDGVADLVAEWVRSRA